MAIDTVRLKSPSVDEFLARRIELKCIKRQGIQMETGELLYEITTGDLLGSWDSRISLKVMREDFIINRNGTPELRPCEPYLLLECSAHKALLGQNVYGGPVNFKLTCCDVVELIEELLGVELPPSGNWIVRRVDWAEVYRLPFPAIQEYFEGIATAQFPRRKGSKYGSHAVHFPGTTTTIKLYHKGIEFEEHDRKRLKHFFTLCRAQKYPASAEANTRWVKRKLEAFQRLANNRLRVEVDIHAQKLDFDFGHQPSVNEVTDDYLKGVHDQEVYRLLREGKSGMETVRENRAVSKRLVSIYGDTCGNQLFGFWLQMAGLGEEICKGKFKRATFYRNRKHLVDAGVSWLNTNVHIIPSQSALPADFAPLRTDPRICTRQARSKPAFMLERDFLKLAA